VQANFGLEARGFLPGLVLVGLPELLLHGKSTVKRPLGLLECGHDRITDGFDNSTTMSDYKGREDIVMALDEQASLHIPILLEKTRGAYNIGKHQAERLGQSLIQLLVDLCTKLHEFFNAMSLSHDLTSILMSVDIANSCLGIIFRALVQGFS
jgi:hypothetical protein